MIRLPVGELLDMADDAAISLTLVQPALADDAAARSWSYPFGVPMSAANVAALEHPQKVGSSGALASYDAELVVAGLPILRGSLAVIRNSGTAAEVSVTGAERDVMKAMEAVSIRGLLPVVSIPQGESGQWVMDIEMPMIPTYSLKLQGVLLLYSPPSGSSDVFIAAALVSLINAQFPDHPIASAGGGPGTATLILTNDDPNFIVHFDYNTPNHNGLPLVSERTLGEARTNNFEVYILDELATPADSHVWPWWVNYAAYPVGSVLNYAGAINPATRSAGVWSATLPSEFAGPNRWECTWCPMVRMSFVLQELCAAVGLDGVGGVFDDIADMSELVLWNAKVLDAQIEEWRMDTLGGLPEQVYRNMLADSFDLGKRVPDWNGAELVAALCKEFALYTEVVDNRLMFRLRRSALDLPRGDWSGLVQARSLRLTPKSDAGWSIDYVRDAGEGAVVPGQLTKLTDGAGGFVVSLPWWSVYDRAYYLGTDSLLVAVSDVPVSSAAIAGTEAVERSPRLAFYRGLGTSVGGKAYHWAQSGDSGGSIGLGVDGNGLYDNFFKGVIEVDAGAWEVECDALLTVGEVLKLRKQRGTVQVQGGANGPMRVLIGEVNVELLRGAWQFVAKIKGVVV